MIRIGYFGDGPWASRALTEIVKFPDLFEIKFITPRFDTQDPVLKKWAETLNVPFLISENVNDESFINQIAPFQCDVLVSMSFNQILRDNIRNCTPHGFINCHAGALPKYRGRNPLNWVLINDEKDFGVTVHYVDAGIDTGNIIIQKTSPITDVDNYASLLERAHVICADAVLEALTAIEKGAAKNDIQAGAGFYCGRRRAGDEVIEWNWSARQIFNFTRALTLPGPCARTDGEAGTIAIIESEIIPDATNYISTTGEIVGRTAKGAIVKCGDSTLLITKTALVGMQGNVGEVSTPKWKIGTRIGYKGISS